MATRGARGARVVRAAAAALVAGGRRPAAAVALARHARCASAFWHFAFLCVSQAALLSTNRFV